MSDKIDPGTSTYEERNKPALSIAVAENIAQLGGKPGDLSKVSILDLPPGLRIPDAFRQLLAVQWPDHETTLFGAADTNGPFHWAQHIRFLGGQYADHLDFGFADRGAKELVRFAHARGTYFILLDLNDPDPSDPQVFHVSSGSYVPLLGDGIRLSRFLAALVPIQVQA